MRKILPYKLCLSCAIMSQIKPSAGTLKASQITDLPKPWDAPLSPKPMNNMPSGPKAKPPPLCFLLGQSCAIKTRSVSRSTAATLPILAVNSEILRVWFQFWGALSRNGAEKEMKKRPLRANCGCSAKPKRPRSSKSFCSENMRLRKSKNVSGNTLPSGIMTLTKPSCCTTSMRPLPSGSSSKWIGAVRSWASNCSCSLGVCVCALAEKNPDKVKTDTKTANENRR